MKSNLPLQRYKSLLLFITYWANPGIGGHFRKLKISSKLWWLQLHIWYQIEGTIIIFHLKLKGHAVKLKYVDYKTFWKNMIFAKNTFLKLENIHNFDTYFNTLRNIVLKLFDDKCKSKSMWNLNTIILDALILKSLNNLSPHYISSLLHVRKPPAYSLRSSTVTCLFFFFTLFNHLYLELVGERKHKKDNQANI